MYKINRLDTEAEVRQLLGLQLGITFAKRKLVVGRASARPGTVEELFAPNTHGLLG
jgi:hypothetical protein